jgi:hypothetical protein
MVEAVAGLLAADASPVAEAADASPVAEAGDTRQPQAGAVATATEATTMVADITVTKL